MSVFTLTYVDEDDTDFTARSKIRSKEAIVDEVRRMHGDGLACMAFPDRTRVTRRIRQNT